MRQLANLLALIIPLSACNEAPLPTDGQVEGARFGLSLATHIQDSMAHHAPYRCARLSPERVPPTGTLEGPLLRLEQYSDHKTLKIAFLADARGNDASTMEGIQKLRAQFKEESVDVVISLGGQAQKRSEMADILRSLTTDAEYLLIALPGDREEVASHRAVITELTKSGVSVLDGAANPILQLGPLTLALLPGISMPKNLVAGSEGCVHTASDVEHLVEFLEEMPEPESRNLVLATYAPLRDFGIDSSDRGIGAIHIGEQVLSKLRSATPRLWVHGMLPVLDTSRAGKLRPNQAAVSLATGSVDPLDGPSTALLVSLTGQKLSWKRI